MPSIPGTLFLTLTLLLLAGCGSGSSGTQLRVPVPEIVPQAGAYAAPLRATVSDPTPGAFLCYSVAGDPAIVNGVCAAGSLPYSGPVTIPAPGATLRVIAGAPGQLNSAIGSAAYQLLTPQIALSANSLAFGAQPAGTGSAPQVVTLSNVGSAPLQLESIALTGANALAFTETNTCVSPLAVGASCLLTVGFTPSAAGSLTAVLQITGDMETPPATLALSGLSTAPAVSLTATALQFPDTDAALQAAPMGVQLTNSGTASLRFSNLSVTGAGAAAFQQTNTCGSSLAVGASCSITVSFGPQAAASYVAQLSISDNASSSPQSIALNGKGLPDAPLTIWHDAYQHCGTEVVNIVVLGDSRSIVDATIRPSAAATLADTFGQKWPDRLRAMLAAKCGSHGTGLVPLLPLAGFSDLNGDYYQGSGTWVASFRLGPYQYGGVPAGMALQATSPLTVQFDAHEAFDHLNVFCESGPGLHPWAMTIDDQPVGSCGGAGGTEQAQVATSTAVPLGQHTAAMTCAEAPCVAYGMEATAGTTGVSVHNLAVGSCTAECFGLTPASQLAFSDLIGGGQQLVIMTFVTNEPGVGYSVDSFRASLGNIIEHERALPGSPSVLLYAPLQDILPGQGPYYPVLPGVAETYATAYFDLRDTYGAGFLPQYFGPDQTHENNAGHDAIFQKVFSTLLP